MFQPYFLKCISLYTHFICKLGYNSYKMEQSELIEKAAEIEREIALLPEGSITKKKINGKEYYYHRVTLDGKRKEIYIRPEELASLTEEIERRKKLEKEYKSFKSQIKPSSEVTPSIYKTAVRVGDELKALISTVRTYKKRECIKELREYIYGPHMEKVFILYGLRRTGKTTLIRQIISEMNESMFLKSAFIQIKQKDTLADLDDDLRHLRANGYEYVFIDEVTMMEDFIMGAALFSDIYASSGMKIVLSGEYSLGFAFSKEEELYDRCFMLHTTFIPYKEFEEVLGIKGIDEYIRYGGTMSLGGINYNENSIFANEKNAEEYIDTAIAKNIQHSLSLYQNGGHFRSLLDLYEKGKLTNVVNRVVENINHSFTKGVIEKAFKSHDLSQTASNLLKDRENPINLKAHMDIDVVTEGLMKALDILNKEDQSIEVNDAHMAQIKEYLLILDLIDEIDLEYLPDVKQNGKLTVITQSGLRYAQAQAIVENLLSDDKFKELSLIERSRVLDRLLSEIRGRMMEEIVLLETKKAKRGNRVFKLQFPIGEFDMIVCDSKSLTCEIYEVKYCKVQVSEQYRHLIDKEKCSMTSHRYGDITGRFVIYRGETTVVDGIQYINVEEYLKSL